MRRAIGILAAGIALAGIHAQAAVPSQNSNKETVQFKASSSKPFSLRNFFGGFGGPSEKIGYKTIICNQRQYRKWMRQTPQMRRSKKCRK